MITVFVPFIDDTSIVVTKAVTGVLIFVTAVTETSTVVDKTFAAGEKTFFIKERRKGEGKITIKQ